MVLSLLVNMIFVGASGVVIYKKGGIGFIKDQFRNTASSHEFSDYYVQKKDIFEVLDKASTDKVFLGDSITEHGELQEYFPDVTVLNRGITGDISKGVLNRVNEVVDRSPKEVYLMIGVNDILNKVDKDDYRDNIEKIIQSFDKDSTKVILQSILPVNNDIYSGIVTNTDIIEFNDILKEIANKHEIQYIDLYPNFTDEDGQLKKEFTVDGIHLNGQGYEVWMNNL